MDAADCALLHQFVISELGSAGLDRDRLVAQAGIPTWALTGDGVMIPDHCFPRVWELAEHALDDPYVAARVASRYDLGRIGLYDYLFSTAPTLGEGLAACGPFISSVSTNFRFDTVPSDEGGVTFALHMVNGGGRGRELAMQWGFVAIVARARIAAAGQVIPLRVTYRQRAPRSHVVLTDFFGTSAVEFDAEFDSVTFDSADLELPLTTADPTLAAILQRHAATLPPPPPLDTAWPDRVAKALVAERPGEATLARIAQQLAVSPRSLQRHLADAGTTWRLELDRARWASRN